MQEVAIIAPDLCVSDPILYGVACDTTLHDGGSQFPLSSSYPLHLQVIMQSTYAISLVILFPDLFSPVLSDTPSPTPPNSYP